MQINTIGLWVLASKFLGKKIHVFTKWDVVPFFMGEEYSGIARWVGEPVLGQIGLNPSLTLHDNDEQLRLTWLHEIGHFAMGHVAPGRTDEMASFADWLTYRENGAETYAWRNLGKLQTLIEADGYEKFSEFVGASAGEWWARGRALRRVERIVSGAVAASLGGRHSQPQRPGTGRGAGLLAF